MGKVLEFPSHKPQFATLFVRVMDTGFNVKGMAINVTVGALQVWLDRLDTIGQYPDCDSMSYPDANCKMVRHSNYQLVGETLNDLASEEFILTEYTDKYQVSNLIPAVSRQVVVDGGIGWQVHLKKGGAVQTVALSREDLLEIGRSRFRPGSIRTNGS